MREEADYSTAVQTFKGESTVDIQPWVDRLDHLRVTITGIKDTPYKKVGNSCLKSKCPLITLIVHLIASVKLSYGILILTPLFLLAKLIYVLI